MSRYVVLRLGRPPFSVRIDIRVPAILLALFTMAFGALVLNVGTGEYPIPPLDVARTIFGYGQGDYDLIVNTLRLPRALVAFLVGGAMALSGAILQGLTRNPLASPDVVGVTSGASLAAAAVLLLAPGAPLWALPVAALAGAAVTALITYVFAWKDGSSPIRLLLVGIGVAAAANALMTLLLVHSKSLIVNKAMVWMTGSVYGRSWEHLTPLLPWLAVFVPLALVLARHLNALHLGDDVARGLGARLEYQRGLLLVTCVALAGAAVATAGTVGFVGLMAPHIARRLVGPSHGGLLPTAAMVGGLIVLLADLVGRTLFAPLEIPCGVVTAAIGAPYFLFLLYRSRHV